MLLVLSVLECLNDLNDSPSEKTWPLLAGLEEARSATQSLASGAAKKDQPERYDLLLLLVDVEEKRVALRIAQSHRVVVEGKYLEEHVVDESAESCILISL